MIAARTPGELRSSAAALGVATIGVGFELLGKPSGGTLEIAIFQLGHLADIQVLRLLFGFLVHVISPVY
jgi:hypothetical protein